MPAPVAVRPGRSGRPLDETDRPIQTQGGLVVGEHPQGDRRGTGGHQMAQTVLEHSPRHGAAAHLADDEQPADEGAGRWIGPWYMAKREQDPDDPPAPLGNNP